MGANREMLQTMAYEPMVLLTAVGFYLATGSFKVSDIVRSSGLPPIVYLPGVFCGFLFILTIKLRKLLTCPPATTPIKRWSRG